MASVTSVSFIFLHITFIITYLLKMLSVKCNVKCKGNVTMLNIC